MKKLLLLNALIIAVTITGHAQISYHDIDPDTTVNTWNAFFIQPSSSTSNNLIIWWHPSPEVVVQTNGDCEILFGAGSLPAKLNAGDSVSSSGSWNIGAYDALSSGGTGNWQTSATDKYLGFRFKNSTSIWYYGWLKMSVGTGASSFTVKEWAYNSQPGKSIKAGQTSATTGIVSAMYSNNIGIINNNRKLTFTNLEAGVKYQAIVAGIGGQIVRSMIVTTTDVFDMNDLATGVYVIQVSGGGQSHNFRVVVQ